MDEAVKDTTKKKHRENENENNNPSKDIGHS